MHCAAVLGVATVISPMPNTMRALRRVLELRALRRQSIDIAALEHTLMHDAQGRAFLRLTLTMIDGSKCDVDATEAAPLMFLYEANAHQAAVDAGAAEPPKLNA